MPWERVMDSRHHHPRLAVPRLSAIDPDWSGGVDEDGELETVSLESTRCVRKRTGEMRLESRVRTHRRLLSGRGDGLEARLETCSCTWLRKGRLSSSMVSAHEDEAVRYELWYTGCDVSEAHLTISPIAAVTVFGSKACHNAQRKTTKAGKESHLLAVRSDCHIESGRAGD